MPHLSDPRIEADCLTGLGGVEAAAEQTDLAMRSFGQALLISEEIHYWQGRRARRPRARPRTYGSACTRRRSRPAGGPGASCTGATCGW